MRIQETDIEVFLQARRKCNIQGKAVKSYYLAAANITSHATVLLDDTELKRNADEVARIQL